MTEKPIINHHSGVAYLPQSRVVVSFPKAKGVGTGATNVSDGDSQVITKPKNDYNGGAYVSWGLNNRFPQDIIELIGKCGVASAALLYNILSSYGSGIEVGKFIFEDGKKRFEPLDITLYPEVEDFFLGSDIQDDYLIDSLSDLFWFANFFPYVILNKGRNKINKLYIAEAADTRYKKRNDKNQLTHIGVCSDWSTAADVIDIPVISDYDPIADLKSKQSGFRFAMPGYFPSPGKSFYQLPYWDSVRTNGWIDNATKVPEYLKAVFKHASNFKYHILIPNTHFTSKYKDYESKTEAEQIKIQYDEITLMNDTLAGVENAQKNFYSFYAVDKINGKEIPGWKIEPIADISKDGKYLPESSAANSEILFAFLTHPDLIGAGTPGGSYSSRGNSGSNTRETDIIKKANLVAYRHRVLKPIYTVKRFNNWPKELQFRTDDTVLTTLDNGSQAIKSIQQ